MIRRGLILATICLSAGVSFAQDATFDLAKKPTFRPGDSVTLDSNRQSAKEVTAGGKVTESEKETLVFSERQEVLAVDAAGAPAEVRLTILSADLEETAGLLKETRKTAIRDLWLTGKRDGTHFVWDTAMLAAKEPNALLKASQVALLKRLVGQPGDWDAYPEDAVLLPKSPVPVGHAWSPAAEDLQKWVENSPAAKSLSAKVRGASFKLVSAAGQTAVVEGNVSATAAKDDMAIDLSATLHCRIDTQSGRWTENGEKLSLTVKSKEALVQAGGTDRTAIQFAAGAGKPSAAPAWKNDLGWAKPAADTNSFKDKLHGVSLNVPEECKAEEVKEAGPVFARFRSADRCAIAITAQQTPILLDVEDVATPAIESLKKSSIEGYEVVRKESLTLPNNVPAFLIVGTSRTSGIHVITIIGVDGRKCISVSLAAPTTGKWTADRLVEFAKTLRSFDEEE
jgi:hypothetical protein